MAFALGARIRSQIWDLPPCSSQIAKVFSTFLSGLYTVFAVVLILLRKSEILRDKRGIPAVLTAHRHVKSGWSMYVAWLVFVLTALTGGAWIALSLELRKTRASYNYNVKYKQICGT